VQDRVAVLAAEFRERVGEAGRLERRGEVQEQRASRRCVPPTPERRVDRSAGVLDEQIPAAEGEQTKLAAAARRAADLQERGPASSAPFSAITSPSSPLATSQSLGAAPVDEAGSGHGASLHHPGRRR